MNRNKVSFNITNSQYQVKTSIILNEILHQNAELWKDLNFTSMKEIDTYSIPNPPFNRNLNFKNNNIDNNCNINFNNNSTTIISAISPIIKRPKIQLADKHNLKPIMEPNWINSKPIL